MAFGLRDLFHADSPNAVASRRCFGVIQVVLLVLMVGIVWNSFAHPVAGESSQVTALSGLKSAVFAGLMALLIFLRIRGVPPPRSFTLPGIYPRRHSTGPWWGLALILVVSLDLMTHMPNLNQTVTVRAYEPNAVKLTPLPKLGEARLWPQEEAYERSVYVPESDPFHYVGRMRLGLLYNCNLLDDLPKLDGFFPLFIQESSLLEMLVRRYSPPGLMDFLSITHTNAPGKITDWLHRTTAQPWVTAGPKPVFYDPAQTVAALTNAVFNPAETVYLPLEIQSLVTATNAAKIRIRQSKFTAHQVELEVEAQDPGWVVVAQSYYHPWQVYIEGRKGTLWRANYGCQAFEVPAGHSRVTLRYEDSLFNLGAALSGLTFLVCLGWAIGSGRRPAF